MNNSNGKLVDFIIKVGQSIKEEVSGRSTISEINKDIKIAADQKLHKEIESYLYQHYSYSILSEEDQRSNSYTSFHESLWIIDPLDGSMNFSRQIPLSCISLCLWEGEHPNFGCIYDFNRDEVYVASDRSCTLSKKKITVSNISKIHHAILCTGFPSWRDYQDESLSKFLQKIKNWKKIRAIGSAALSLAWVARGWVDAYFEEDIRIWDVAAGLALVKAAGGEIYLKENERPNFVTAIATNGKIPIEELL